MKCCLDRVALVQAAGWCRRGLTFQRLARLVVDDMDTVKAALLTVRTGPTPAGLNVTLVLLCLSLLLT